MSCQRYRSRESVWKNILLGCMLFAPLIASAVPCDVNGSGRVDAADIQMIINATLGRSVPFSCDVDGSGHVDARDMQLTVNASLGHSVGVPVPDVIGLSLEDAEAVIRTAGLTIDAVTRIYSIYVPEGNVMTEIPLPGAIAWPGTGVDLTVSNGPHPVNNYTLERVLPQIYEPWYFDYPQYIATGPDGSVYVGESDSRRIMHFSNSGGLLAEWCVEGSGTRAFRPTERMGPIAVAPDNSVYVLSGEVDFYSGVGILGNPRIQRFTSFGAFMHEWQPCIPRPTSTAYSRPSQDLEVGPDGSVYVLAVGPDILKFTPNGEFLNRWSAYTGPHLYSPLRLAIGPDGSMYVMDSGSHVILQLTSFGEPVKYWEYHSGPPLYISLHCIRDLSVGTDGSVYVLSGWQYSTAGSTCNNILQFTASGDFVRTWGSLGLGDAQFDDAQGIAVSPDGSVYVADSLNKRIQKFTATGSFVAKWGSIGTNEGEFASPKGVAVAQDGTFYVADTGNHRIQRFSSSGEFLNEWGTRGVADGQFESPYDVATTPDGSVYAIDSTGRIQQFTATGIFVVLWNPLGPEPNYPYRYGIAVGPDGSVYTVSGRSSMKRFTAPGVLAGTWDTEGSGEGEFIFPVGVAVGPDGFVYVADAYNCRIQKLTASGQFVAQWGVFGEGDGQFKYPVAVTVSPDGSIFVCESSNDRIRNNRIQRFTSDGVFIEKWGSFGIGHGQFREPWAVAAGPDGEIYVADTGNNRIQKFVLTQ